MKFIRPITSVLLAIVNLMLCIQLWRMHRLPPTAWGWTNPSIILDGGALGIQVSGGHLSIACVSTNISTGKVWFFNAAIPDNALHVITNHARPVHQQQILDVWQQSWQHGFTDARNWNSEK